MFVAEGAKENILNRRRNEFFDHYVKIVRGSGKHWT